MVKILNHQNMEETPRIGQQIDQEMQRIYQEITEEGKESQICGWEGSQRSMVDIQARRTTAAPRDLNETNEDSYKINNNGSKFSLKTDKADTTTHSGICPLHDGIHSYRVHCSPHCGHPHDGQVSPPAGTSFGTRPHKVKQPNYMI